MHGNYQMIFFPLEGVEIKMKKIHIEPDKLAFILTDKCTASCDMCCFGCSPQNSTFQSLEIMKALIQEAAERKSFSIVGFSGGEPFLAYKELLEATKFAHQLGLSVICTSNGFWGADKEGAKQKLIELKNAGLSKLSLSCDLFHQQYVAIDSLNNILSICKELDISTDIGSVITRDKCDLSQITSCISLQLINVPHYRTPCLPIGNAKLKIHPDMFIYDDNLLEKENHCYECSYFAIYINGDVYPCCSQIGEIKSLRLGNIHTDNLQALYDSYNTNMYLRIIKKYGLAWFVEIAKSKKYSPILNRRYVNKCHLCHSIFSDTDFLSIVEPYISREKEKIYQKFLMLQQHGK